MTMSPIQLEHIVYNDSISVGSIIKIDGIKTKNTVLDEDFQNNGGYITFENYKVYDNWKRIIKGIYVPPLKVTYEMDNNSIAVLHPLAVRANIVARMFWEMKNGTKEFTNFSKSVHSYFTELSNTIFGKSGIFNRFILGPRLKKSFRAVVVPGNYSRDIFGESYEWAGIPERIFNNLKIQEGDIVVIGRDPTIWMGSIEYLYAYPVAHDSIELHPLLLPQLGGDHDGDQVWGYYPNRDLGNELLTASFTREHARWQKNFNLDYTSNSVNWKDYRNDQMCRIRTTGFSVGPSDILDNTKDLNRVLNYCSSGSRTRGKADHEELLECCKGLSLDNWKATTEAINRAQLSMKIFMGPVGLLALRLIVLGNIIENIKISAHYLAERCAQGLLDAKHLTFEQIKCFKPARIFEILNLRDKSIKNANDMLKALQEIVPCDEKVLPVLEFIFCDGRGIAKMSQQDFDMFEGITSTASMSKDGYMPAEVLNGIDPEYDLFNFAFHNGSKDCYI